MLKAETIIIEGKTLSKDQQYYEKFSSFEIFEIDVEALRKTISESPRTSIEAQLKLGRQSYTLQLFKYSLINKNCKVRSIGENGWIDNNPDPTIETYRGYNSNFNGGESVLTIAKNFMSLMFKQGEENYYLEQVKFNFNDSNSNKFILYTKNSVRTFADTKTNSELADELEEDQREKVKLNSERNFICWEIDIALAADFSFYKSYGKDLATTEARLTAIVNLIQPDWLYPKMIADYIWNISALFVAEDSLRDPFRTATTIANQLSIFSTVGFNIFQGGFDVATCWTSKFQRPPVYAYAGTACLFTPFSVCSEAAKNDAFVRQLQSHVCGHHFTAADDGGGSPTIMNPNISGYNVWSIPSQYKIYEGAWTVRACLNDCSGGYIPIAEFSATPTNGCIPLEVQFNNMSTNGVMYKWKFPGGTPSTSTDKNPKITYNSIGSFAVELEVLNPKCSTTVEKLDYIVTRDKPRFVNFTYGAANLGNDIEFFGDAIRGETWIWKFHDNTTEEGQYVVKTFPKEGEFDVELCVSNDCGEVCVKKKISNYFKPTADFTSDTTAGCAPTTIKFFDLSSSNVINWTWSFPGGTPTGSFVKNPIVKYTRPGTYKVKLVVSSKKNNDQKEKEMYITIDSLPLAQFNPVVNLSTVRFDNTTLYGKSFEWDFGDGNKSMDSTPTHNFKDGRYEVILKASNGCGTTITKRTITIGAKPIAGFSVANSDGCVPYTVKFLNTSTATAQSFEWFFPGGNPSTSTEREPTITYNAIGSYDVKLIARGGVESDSITQLSFIRVAEGPTAAFQNSIAGFEAFFTNQSVKANKYFWEFGDGKSSIEMSPSHNYGVEGEFNVRLITENDCGIDTFEKVVAVYLIPKVNFTSDKIRGCAPFQVNFKDQSSIDVIEWSWQFESGTPVNSSQKDPIVTFNKAGKFTVKLSVKNTNGTNSSTKLRYIEVLSPVTCPKRPNKKEKPDGKDFGGLYDDNKLEWRSADGFNFEIYPNPASNELFIKGEPGTKLILLSMVGQRVLDLKMNSSFEKIDLSIVSEGTYLLKIENREFTDFQKIIISR